DPNGKIQAKLSGFTNNPVQPGLVLASFGVMTGHFNLEQQSIEGEWRTNVGSSGKFALIKAFTSTAQSAAPPNSQMTQPKNFPPLLTKTVTLGSYRLDSEDLKRLSDVVKSGTNVVLPTVNAQTGGRSFIHIGPESLLADPNIPAVVYD